MATGMQGTKDTLGKSFSYYQDGFRSGMGLNQGRNPGLFEKSQEYSRIPSDLGGRITSVSQDVFPLQMVESLAEAAPQLPTE